MARVRYFVPNRVQFNIETLETDIIVMVISGQAVSICCNHMWRNTVVFLCSGSMKYKSTPFHTLIQKIQNLKTFKNIIFELLYAFADFRNIEKSVN